MKRIRIKKDIDCKLTVLTNGEAVSLEGDSIVLVMVYPDNKRAKLDYEDITDNVIHFHVSPDNQPSTGVYGFEVWKNIGSGYQSVCDCMRAFELVSLSIMEGGDDDADFGTDSADMEAEFNEYIIIIDNLDSYLANAALSANQGRILNNKIKKEVSKRQELVAFDNDDTYVMKAVDAEGNLLIGFKETGEVEVPTGLTDDAYELAYVIYEKLKGAVGSLNEAIDDLASFKNYVNSTFETKSDATTSHDTLQTNIDNEATARQSADTTLQGNIDSLAKDVADNYATKDEIPTKTSQLTNDSGYITSSALDDYAKESDIPTKTSELTNDSGYITSSALDGYAKESDIPTKTSELTNDSGYITSSALDDYETVKDAEAEHTTLENEIAKKQDILTAGTGITIVGDVISSDVDFSEYDKKADRVALIEEGEDDDYVVKAIDAKGNLLVGFKESGEAYIPIGLANDAYDLACLLYEKLKGAMQLIQESDKVADREALIEESEDEGYVLKMQDANGETLQAFTEEGEVEMFNGMPDGVYEVLSAICGKLGSIAECLATINEKLKNL